MYLNGEPLRNQMLMDIVLANPKTSALSLARGRLVFEIEGSVTGALYPITVATDARNKQPVRPTPARPVSTAYTTQDHWIHYAIDSAKVSLFSRLLNE